MEALGKRPATSNLNNVARIKVIRASEVLRIREPREGDLNWDNMSMNKLGMNAIRRKSGAEVWPIYTPPSKAGFVEVPEETEQGTLYRGVLTTFLPNDNAEIRQILQEEAETRFLVVFMDNDGYVRLLGTKKQPATMKKSFQTVEKGWNLEFSCLSNGLCYYLPSWKDIEIFDNE